MIEFNYETDFTLNDEEKYIEWINNGVEVYGFKVGEICYYFYNDTDLHKINLEHLNHDTFTDIISFDYSIGDLISGDICISVDRVKENAKKYNVTFINELHRVMSHGILHFLGFKDKSDLEKKKMRQNEDLFVNMLNNK